MVGPVFGTNMAALYSARALNKHTYNLQKAEEKLSTGFKINSAADDAAGSGMVSRMTARIKSFGAAEQNINDAISLIDTADGGLESIASNLATIKEKVVEAGGAGLSTTDLNNIQTEINDLVTAIEDTATNTKYNGFALLIGGTDKTVQWGADNGNTTTIQLAPTAANNGIDVDIDATTGNGQLSEGAGIALAKLRVTGATTTSQDGTNANAGTLTDIDKMIDNVSRMRGGLGAKKNGLQARLDFIGDTKADTENARSVIRDADIAQETINQSKHELLQTAAASIFSDATSSSRRDMMLSLLP